MPALAPSLDSAPFIPAGALESWFIGAAEGELRSEGALCWVAAPPAAPPSRVAPPVPCAWAKPAPAISAAAATDIIKRLVIEYLLKCLHCPRRQRKELHEVPPVSYTHLRAHETDSYLVCRLLL